MQMTGIKEHGEKRLYNKYTTRELFIPKQRLNNSKFPMASYFLPIVETITLYPINYYRIR